MIGFGVAFLAAFLWAGFDAARKHLGPAHGALPLLALLHTTQLPLFVGWILMNGSPAPPAGYWPWGGAVLVLNLTANGLFIGAVTRSPLSVTIPLLSLTPATTALLGIPLLGEIPALPQWAGIVLVVSGAAWLAILRGEPGAYGPERDDSESHPSLLSRMKREPGVPMMAAVAVLWSLTGPMDKRALAFADLPVHATIQVGGIGLLTTAWLLASGRGRDLLVTGRRAWAVVGGALVGAGAYGLQLLAIKLIFVSLVEAIKRAIGMTSALVLGRFTFGESISVPKVLAVVTMMAGTALLLL